MFYLPIYYLFKIKNKYVPHFCDNNDDLHVDEAQSLQDVARNEAKNLSTQEDLKRDKCVSTVTYGVIAFYAVCQTVFGYQQSIVESYYDDLRISQAAEEKQRERLETQKKAFLSDDKDMKLIKAQLQDFKRTLENYLE